MAVAREFGGHVNQMPFENLMERLNLTWLRKFNGDQLRVDALIFGLAGMLPKKSRSKYVRQMIHEFKYAKKMLGIDYVPTMSWKYARMRPGNFPDIRLAQFASFLSTENNGADLTFSDWDLPSFRRKMKLELHPFWQNHYRLIHSTTVNRNVNLSHSFIDLILINAVIPFFYAISLLEGNQFDQQKVLQLLEQIKPEKNRITTEWKNAGVPIQTAFDSQSLLELKNHSCNRKKCLFCAIGKEALQR